MCNGSFHSAIWAHVRCGIEMAVDCPRYRQIQDRANGFFLR